MDDSAGKSIDHSAQVAAAYSAFFGHPRALAQNVAALPRTVGSSTISFCFSNTHS